MSDSPALFEPFSKIPRLFRECVITEKIDGTNAQILIKPANECSWEEDALALITGDRAVPDAVTIFAGSRNRWLSIGNDNYGFAAWVKHNADELRKLGPGRHFGEWWGAGIQRKYAQTERIFSLFNVDRWIDRLRCTPVDVAGKQEDCPSCCRVVPTLFRGPFSTVWIDRMCDALEHDGSNAAPGFMDPEGIVIWHSASRTLFQKTIKNDESPKGKSNES